MPKKESFPRPFFSDDLLAFRGSLALLFIAAVPSDAEKFLVYFLERHAVAVVSYDDFLFSTFVIQGNINATRISVMRVGKVDGQFPGKLAPAIGIA